jgi:hypothetical protein
MDSKIIFEGDPPFELPEVRSGQADVVDNAVLLTLYAIVPGKGPGPVGILASVTPLVARALAGHLTAAAMLAERNMRLSP